MSTLSIEILRRASLVLLGAVALAGAAGCKGNINDGRDGVCEYNGKSYEPGESFPSDDGCNTCFCDEDGSFGGCTEMYCAAVCDRGDKIYQEGESFSAGDTCNTCTCGAGGEVACTSMDCSECLEDDCDTGCLYNNQLYYSGDQFPAGDGCNTCECMPSGDVVCSGATCPMQACSYEGYYHAQGETWLSNDHCASCTCEPGGKAECAFGFVCNSCYYAGTLYETGQSFPAQDGCNTCTCEGGGVSCTEINCACDPAKEWFRDYVGDPQSCQVIDYELLQRVRLRLPAGVVVPGDVRLRAAELQLRHRVDSEALPVFQDRPVSAQLTAAAGAASLSRSHAAVFG
jgi:hypothetical protein